MLRGEKVTLRAVARKDLPRLLGFWNDLEVDLAGGGGCVGHRELGITIGDRDYWERGYGRETAEGGASVAGDA